MNFLFFFVAQRKDVLMVHCTGRWNPNISDNRLWRTRCTLY